MVQETDFRRAYQRIWIFISQTTLLPCSKLCTFFLGLDVGICLFGRKFRCCPYWARCRKQVTNTCTYEMIRALRVSYLALIITFALRKLWKMHRVLIF